MSEEIIISNTFLDNLESLADQASRGPWIYAESNDSGYDVHNPYEPDYVVRSGWDHEEYTDYGIEKEANAEFIATLNPETVKAMIKRIRMLDLEARALAERVVARESSYLEAGFPAGHTAGKVRQVRYEARQIAEKELAKCQKE